jgi:hypothetical protein
MVAVNVRYQDDTENPVATRSAVHIEATAVDITDETDNSAINYYISADHATADQARSVVFSGDFTWDGWVAPESGAWTFNLRKTEDDSSVADSGAITFDAP